jgi:hypothetical protein
MISSIVRNERHISASGAGLQSRWLVPLKIPWIVVTHQTLQSSGDHVVVNSSPVHNRSGSEQKFSITRDVQRGRTDLERDRQRLTASPETC